MEMLKLNEVTSDEVADKMGEKDALCMDCTHELDMRHALQMYNVSMRVNTPEQMQELLKDPLNAEVYEKGKSLVESNEASSNPIPETTPISNSSNTNVVNTIKPSSSSQNIPAEQLRLMIRTLHDKYKAQWDKNGVVQFKNESIAILQRMFGQQVQFLVAFDQITKEGYRLMAIDEGKTGGQASGG